MNYLAHAYFSFMHEEVLIGNLISDFVKGNKKLAYSEGIQKGISLHRSIDTFTDEHPVTKECKSYFRPFVRLYAGAFVDVVYDHFLAKDNTHWTPISLSEFANYVYSVLEDNYNILPEKLQQMLPYMKSQNWLLNYQYKWGAEKSFQGVSRRALYLNNSTGVYHVFESNYSALESLSKSFLSDVKKFAESQFQLLLKA